MPKTARFLASVWLRHRVAAASFLEWAASRRFKNPVTGNDVLFKSLPKEEQVRIRARWHEALKQPEETTPKVKDPLFHTTSHEYLDQIAANGLVPRAGGGVFNHGGYGEHSQGKVFLSDSPEAARDWQNKVFQQLDHQHGDNEEELGRRVPVMLRVKSRKTKVDPVGDKDVPGSRMTHEEVPPEDIEFWHPKKKQWSPVSEWGKDTDAELAISDRDEHGVYLNEEAFMPTEDEDYLRDWSTARAQAPQEQERVRQQRPRDKKPEENPYLVPETRRLWIEKIKEHGAKAPFPLGPDWDKPGVFPKMWQDRLQVDREGNPLENPDS